MSTSKLSSSDSTYVFLTDDDKIVLEIMCAQMIEELSSIIAWLEEDKKKSADVYVYEQKKDIFKSIVIPNKEIDAQQFDLIKYQIVSVSFLFNCFSLKVKKVGCHLIFFKFFNFLPY